MNHTLQTARLAATTRLGSVSSVLTRRTFATYQIPTGHRYPDGIYRRPLVPPPTQPISEDSDVVFNDGQAPQLAVDYDKDITGWEAFKGIVTSISLTLAVGLGLASLMSSDPPSVKQEFPYNNLKNQLGGPSDLAVQLQKEQYAKFDADNPRPFAK